MIETRQRSQADGLEKQDLTGPIDQDPASSKSGVVLHSAAHYDLLVALVTFGRERVFRENILRLARLQPGQSILDVGCGTGSLAIAAKRRLGATGQMRGVDASPEMLARARKKAKRAGLEIEFTEAFAQQLPFADAQFDRVLSTVMLHHLPSGARAECAREMRRVLKPGGHMLVVDFGNPAAEGKGVLAHLHRHGHVNPGDIDNLVKEVGLQVIDSGLLGMRDLHFVLATAPAPDQAESAAL